MVKSGGFLLAGGLLLAMQSLPAHAVVLEQKWHAGDKLAYDVALNGTVNVQVPADAPVLWAGVPLEVDVNGNGIANMNTLSVDPNGTGVVALGLQQMLLKGEALGQRGQLTINGGKVKVMMNGKPLQMGDLDKVTVPTQPVVALKVAKDGRIKGVASMQQPDQKIDLDNLPAQVDAAPATTTQPTTPGKAVNMGAAMIVGALRALPALWPGRDVQVGESWNANVDVPALARTDAQTGETKPLGQYTLTLKGAETVDGKELQHVTLKGDMALTGDQLEKAFPNMKVQVAAANAANAKVANGAAKPAAPMANPPQLDSATQKVSGDLWFDAANGRIARAELVLDGRAQSHDVKADGKKSEPSWVDFTGSVQFELHPAA